MSKNIPKVRKWRVRYWRFNVKSSKVDDCVYDVVVDAPNKQFAKWAARDLCIAKGAWRSWGKPVDKITVSLAKVQS